MSTSRVHVLYSKSHPQPKGIELLEEMADTESRTRNVQYEASHGPRKQVCA